MSSLNAHMRLSLLLGLTLVSVGCGATQSPSSSSALRSTFQGEVHEFTGPGVLLVVTWADWASTWILLEPELEAFQDQAPANVAFRIVNVDREPEIARRLGAAIVPSVVVVKDGAIVEVLPNVTSAQDLSRVVSKWLRS